MGEFFDPPPPPPDPPVAPPLPEWAGPPDNVLPGTFPLELVLARSEDVVLYVFGGRAYPAGWEFGFGMRTRVPRQSQDPMGAWHGHGDPEKAVRIGFELADGRRATVFDRRSWFDEEQPPATVLRPNGGGGGMQTWEFRFWAWPLPPPGGVDLVVEWPSEGIPLTRVPLDAQAILDGAARAQELWPPPEPTAGAWTRYA